MAVMILSTLAHRGSSDVARRAAEWRARVDILKISNFKRFGGRADARTSGRADERSGGDARGR
tara:strand:- start:87 stop:275 length:189 start_codon:yes stop_codon:yes gene_type:complete